MPTTDVQPRIITFYTYKGGAGCSSALGNVACILASSKPKTRVLMIDWDLETPTLHELARRRVSQSGLKGAPGIGLDDHPGLIELLRDVAANIPEVTEDEEKLIEIVFEDLDLDQYIVQLDPSEAHPDQGLFLLKAGKIDDQFDSRVSRLRWDRIEKKAPWFYRELATRLAESYDYVLIDSSTGLSKASKICTSQMPDTLVTVFAPNEQALTGVTDMARRAIKTRRGSDDKRPLVVFPVPSRLESPDDELQRRWRRGDEEFGGFQRNFEGLFEELYYLDSCDLEPYFDEVRVANVKALSASGRLRLLCEDETEHPNLLRSYQHLAHRLTHMQSPWTAVHGSIPPSLPGKGSGDEDDVDSSEPKIKAPEVVYEIVELKASNGKGAKSKETPSEKKKDEKGTEKAEKGPKKAEPASKAPSKKAPKSRSTATPQPEKSSMGTMIVVAIFIVAAIALIWGVMNRSQRDDPDGSTDEQARVIVDAQPDDAASEVVVDAEVDGSDALVLDADQPEPCPEGQIRHADTQGNCCFPGQVWSEEQEECLGDRCPVWMVEADAGCACPEGKVLADAFHCCWPNQIWSRTQSVCVGDPECPEGWLERERECLFVGTAGQWVLVEAGRFQMGSPSGEAGRDPNEAQYEVVLSQDFLILATEVTQEEYESLIGMNPSRHQSCPRCPVENVTWHEAAVYANRLSEQARLEPCYQCEGVGNELQCDMTSAHPTPYGCRGFRLPTEAEWEFAARAGRDSAHGDGELEAAAWYDDNANQTHDVASREANPWGLSDMLGNVTEWCNDWYGRYPRTATTDPWTARGNGRERVCRGGSFGSDSRDTRFAMRLHWRQRERSEYIGFRVVRTVHSSR